MSSFASVLKIIIPTVGVEYINLNIIILCFSCGIITQSLATEVSSFCMHFLQKISPMGTRGDGQTQDQHLSGPLNNVH